MKTNQMVAVLILLNLTAGVASAQVILKEDKYEVGMTFRGKADVYGSMYEGRKTSSGAILHEDRLTCSSPGLPFGTVLLIENEQNGNKIEAVVNDRGPVPQGKDIYLTRRDALALGIDRFSNPRTPVQYQIIGFEGETVADTDKSMNWEIKVQKDEAKLAVN
jgi:rare lipoprotein A